MQLGPARSAFAEAVKSVNGLRDADLGGAEGSGRRSGSDGWPEVKGSDGDRLAGR